MRVAGVSSAGVRAWLIRHATALRVAVIVAVLALAGYVLAGQWHKVRPEIAKLSAGSLLAALAVGVAAVACSVPAWRQLLAIVEPGHRLPLPVAARIFLLGQLGKYVPGSVWVVVAQTELARRHGVPRQATATAGLLAMGVSLGTALVTFGAFLPFGSADLRHNYWWLTFVALGVLICLTPPVVNPAVGLGLRLLRRPALEQRLTWRGMGIAAGWSFAGWLLYGVHTWLLARALGGSGAVLLPRSIGAFAVAFAIGFVIVVAPAGGGFREAALTSAFSGVLPRGAPLALALVSRALLTVADLLGGALAVVLGRRDPGRLPPPRASSTGESEGPALSPAAGGAVVTTAR